MEVLNSDCEFMNNRILPECIKGENGKQEQFQQNKVETENFSKISNKIVKPDTQNFADWQFPPMTVKQLAKLLENKDVRVALSQLDTSFECVFAQDHSFSFSGRPLSDQNISFSAFSPNLLSNKRQCIRDEASLVEQRTSSILQSKSEFSKAGYLSTKNSQVNILNQPNINDTANLKYMDPDLSTHRKRFSLKAFGEYDMVELKIICDSFHNKDIGICRILAIHSGITLYNLHRCIAITLNIDKRASEEYLHAWIINDGTVYGGGRSCSPAMSRRLSLQTDRHTTYRQLIQLPVDEMGLVHKQCCAPITYIFGKIQCQIYLNDFLLQHTNSADLLWVPRCCDGSFGTTPNSENWKNFRALETFVPEFKVDLDYLNLSLMETRFSRNVASCRRTQRKRMKGIDQVVLNSYRARIHDFFTDRMAIQKLASYVTRQASSNKRFERETDYHNQVESFIEDCSYN